LTTAMRNALSTGYAKASTIIIRESVSYSFFLRVCVYVYGAEHGIGIMLLRCAYHFTFQKGGIILPPRHCMCIVSKITDGFILPFWRGFPHEEKVKLQHVIRTTVKELERKKTVGTDIVFTHVHLYSCRKTVSKWPIRIRHEGTYTVKWKILFQRFLIIIRGFN
jgi:hypothetical protein